MPSPGADLASRATVRSNRPTAAPSKPGWVRWAFWLTVFSMVIPFGVLPVAGAMAPAPTHSAAVLAPAPAPSAARSAVPTANQLVPGSTGASGPALTSAQEMAVTIHPAPAPTSMNGLSSTQSSPLASGGAAVQYVPRTTAPATYGNLHAPVAPSATASPAIYQVPIGWFTGYANDSTDRMGVPSAYLQVYSNALCSTNRCPSTYTNTTGYFNVTCAAPGGPGDNDAIIFTINNWYFDNVSYHVCTAGVTTYVGTTYLLRDGVGIGFVKNAQTGQPIVGVQLVAVTRDGTVQAYPVVTSNPNGSFTMPLPPVPAKIYVNPPAGFEGTFNYTNATPGTGNRPAPWGGGVNLQNFYLIRQTLVIAHLYDSVSKGAIGGGSHSALQACSALANGCNTQGIGVYGSRVSAFANPGWDYFEAFTDGHMEGSTAAIFVPQEPPGTDYSIANIYLAPIGQFHIESVLSTPSGGTSAWKAAIGSPGSLFVDTCSLDGYWTSFYIPSGTYYQTTFNMSSDQCVSPGCYNPGSMATMSAPPLRTYVLVEPDTTGLCNPLAGPQWPTNGNDPPPFENYTYVNLTGGHMLGKPSPVWVNISVGDYIAGKVYIKNSTSAPPCYIVASTSTDNNNWNSESFDYNPCAPYPQNVYSPCAGIQSAGSTSFCIAVAPGATKITITSPGYETNWTWTYTPLYCCKLLTSEAPWPALLRQATSDHIQSINLTPDLGQVHGWALLADTANTGIPIVTVSVCPTASQSTASCQTGLGINGTFYNVPAPIGTDYVTVTAPGYAANQAWVNVTPGSNVSAGVIPMYALAVLDGKVVGPGGSPIYLADVHVCNIAGASACEGGGGANLGPGVTSSDGEFNGTVQGGWLPWASYVVSLVAPGYTSDFAFVNASVGNYSTVPTMTLYPIGVNSSHLSPHPAANGPGTGTAAGVWITGRIWTNATGGVYIPAGSSFQFCPLGSLLCTPIADGSNTEGYFNQSVTPGLYFLNISVDGYEVYSLFINASQAAYINLGDVFLNPDYWVAGRLVISQWAGSINEGGNATFGFGYAPAAAVEGCNLGRTECTNALPAATNGSYNVPIPPSSSATIVANPSGAAFAGSPAGGYTQNLTSIHNITSANTTLTGTVAYLPMDIFGMVGGRIWDNNSINSSTSGTAAAYGLQYPSFSVQTLGNNTATAAWWANGGGFWSAFLPGNNGPNRTLLAITDSPGYTAFAATIGPAIDWGPNFTWAGNSSLERFGWVVAQFNSSVTSAPISDVAATATVTSSAGSFSGSDASNGAGYLNVTAPFGSNVLVTASAPDFNSTAFSLTHVNSSSTTSANGTLSGYLIPYHLDPWGWVISTPVNYTDGTAPPIYSYPAPIVRDSTNGLGVPGVLVQVVSPSPTVASGGSNVGTNWDGQFYGDAPIGPADSVQFSHVGFLTNSTNHPVKPGSYTIFGNTPGAFQEVNMTGEAVVWGLVQSLPGNAPVIGATVTVQGLVKNVVVTTSGISNESGYFWVEAPPGPLTITVAQTNYVSGVSYVTGCSDCYVYAGNITLSSFGEVTGNVRGLPAGLPLQLANASLCSTLGTPTGPCGPAAQTDYYGHFAVSAAPGNYILEVNDSYYNASYLPIALGPGEVTSVGTIDLLSFGTDSGTVYYNSAPIAGVEVIACPTWSGGVCPAEMTTNAAGQYSFSGAPGPYSIQASLTGYQTATEYANVKAGYTTTVKGIELQSIGTNQGVTFSGKVVDAQTGIGVGGVSLAAYASADTTDCRTVSSGSAGNTATSGNGSYTFTVGYGTYLVVAADKALGYQPQGRCVFASGNHAGINFQLTAQLYTISGQVTDALTGYAVNGSTIALVADRIPVQTLAVTDPSGAFSFQLANSSSSVGGATPSAAYQLVAESPASSSVPYSATYFSVTVNGRSMVRNVSLTPGVSTLNLRVISSASHLPLVGANVRIQGILENVYRFDRVYTATSDGSVVTSLYVGAYAATVSFAGYTTRQVDVTLNSSGAANVTVGLAPAPGQTGSAATPGSSLGGATVYLAAGAAVAAIVAAGVLAGRPKRSMEPTARAGSKSAGP